MMKISKRLFANSMFSQIAWRLVSFQNFVTRLSITSKVSTRMNRDKFVRLGTKYGGWWVARTELDQNVRGKVLISAGIGFDVSFDSELAACHFELICIDPLAESIAFAKTALSSFHSVQFHNLGLANCSGTRIFYPPKIASHDSWSLIDIQNGNRDDQKEFKTIGLNDLLESIDRVNKFIYLKMDIEGAEKEVLDSLIENRVEVDFLGVEMDYISLIPFFGVVLRIKEVIFTRALLKRMSKLGYQLVGTEGFNFFWART